MSEYKTREVEIINLVTRLVEDCNLMIPIDLDKLVAEFKDIELVYEDSTLMKADIVKTDKGYTIVATSNKTHNRFSIAHQLGHLFLGHTDYTDNQNDIDANEFAANLLMPKKNSLIQSMTIWMKMIIVIYFLSQNISTYHLVPH